MLTLLVTPRRSIALLTLVAILPAPCSAQQLTFKPLNETSIYQLRESAGWTVTLPADAAAPTAPVPYVVKTNNLDVVKQGQLDFAGGKATIEVQLDRPAMLYAEVTPPAAEKPIALGAAVAPDKLQPVVPCPDDFDAFWTSKLAQLRSTPPNPVVKPGDSGDPFIDYATITFDNIDGRHVHGQLAKPKRPGKFPAMLILQWASPPYPLDKSWVLGPAANGWLCLNVEPHDVLPAEPPSYYDALPDSLKHYESLGHDDRDRSHFLYMFLGDVRAADYLASHPDWNGKTLLVTGTSMGGMQSFAVAGLHPQVTHLIVNVPAGCDLNASLHGRQMGYPFFPADNPQVMETARYFDAVNFAPRIKARSLVAPGFVDDISPPAGIWTAYNQIPAPKEIVPLVDSPHNHLATPEQQAPYVRRSDEWMTALARGVPILEPGYDDHQNMMQQLGIRALRPGADGNDPQTYDEAQANRYRDSLPDVLTTGDGTKVTRADQWPERRAELLELFAREIYGRVPANVPKITWKVTAETHGEARFSGPGSESTAIIIPTVTKTLVGHVDNSACPEINVDIQASVTVPADDPTPRPVIVMFGGFGNFSRPRSDPRPWTDQAIAHGWAYATINPNSIQGDNDSLRAGIIGLTNQGRPRKPDDWGALRAWAWGASQLIDYFETHPDLKIDPQKVGVVGLSRYGKAALVAQACDERIAVGFIGSSGEGGAKLHRHVFGERVENLTGGFYYWMAGNFLKYGAAESTFGSKTAADLPVDSHELIALCAPRPCFISHGVPEAGDANWIDARGAFMAGVLAGPVYRLLGKQDFGTPGDYLTDPLPPVEQLIGGELAWRQHPGGHDLTPNWPAFFDWIGKYIEAPPASSVVSSQLSVATKGGPQQRQQQLTTDNGLRTTPVERTDPNSRLAHQQLLAKAKQGRIDVYFLGDSITRRWGCTDPQWASLMENWKKNFFGYNAANFGWGGDSTPNILWRIQNGELDGVNPKVIVLLAGTNDVGSQPPADADAKAAEVVRGVQAIVDVCRQKTPDAVVILTAIFPRNDNMAVMPTINKINDQLAKLADGKRVRFLSVNDKLADASGKLHDGMMGDGLHPAVAGYQVWADGLKPILVELLGPPAKKDHAPPPTGDPSAN